MQLAPTSEHLNTQRQQDRHCVRIHFWESELLIFVILNRFDPLCFEGRNPFRITQLAGPVETVLPGSN